MFFFCFDLYILLVESGHVQIIYISILVLLEMYKKVRSYALMKLCIGVFMLEEG